MNPWGFIAQKELTKYIAFHVNIFQGIYSHAVALPKLASTGGDLHYPYFRPVLYCVEYNLRFDLLQSSLLVQLL